jgi:hypothetical protein
MKSAQVICAIICLASAASCAAIEPIEGVVIDTSTAKPIPGAFVIDRWTFRGSDGYGSRSSCPHVEVVQADSDGRFRMTGSGAPNSFGVQREVTAYKAGFEIDFSRTASPLFTSMKPFRGSGDARLNDISRLMTLMLCGPRESFGSTLHDLFEALDTELAMLELSNSKKSEYPRGVFSRILLERAKSRAKQRDDTK